MSNQQNQQQSVDGINREKWYEFWERESQYCEQKYLTPDTHGIILEYITHQQSAVLETVRKTIKQELEMWNGNGEYYANVTEALNNVLNSLSNNKS